MKSSTSKDRVVQAAQKKIVGLRQHIARLDHTNAQLAQHIASQVAHIATDQKCSDPSFRVASEAQPYGIEQDIVTAKQTEQRLQSLSERLEQVLRTSSLATIEIDTHGVIRRWNPAAEQLFGWSAEEAVGREALPLLVPGIAVEYVQVILKAMAHGHIFSRQSGSKTKDGRTITCQWYNTLIYDDHGRVLGALLQLEQTGADRQTSPEAGLCKAVGDSTSYLAHGMQVDSAGHYRNWL